MVNLITIADYKVYKEINSETYDPIISSLITAASSFIKEYCDRSFIDYSLIDKTEYFNALEYHRYTPEEFPLISVTSLSTSIDGGVTLVALTENTDFFVDYSSEGGEDSIISNTGLTGFVSGTIPFKSGKIVYKGGYVQTPQDLKIATMDLVHYWRLAEHTQNKSMGSAAVQFPVATIKGANLPKHIKRVLDLYRII